MTSGYVFDNSLDDEGARLRLLERIADPRSIELLERFDIGPGWRCLELGAGGGSMAAWLADRIGPGGLVVAVDRDVTQCRHLDDHPGVEVVESDIEDVELAPGTFDLVHSRNVLMHIERSEKVIERALAALRPGGWRSSRRPTTTPWPASRRPSSPG